MSRTGSYIGGHSIVGPRKKTKKRRRHPLVKTKSRESIRYEFALFARRERAAGRAAVPRFEWLLQEIHAAGGIDAWLQARLHREPT
jgi:hypothetical protein